MKKILFISTGGTIASTQKEEGMAPTLTAEDLISAVPGIREVCDIDTRLLMNIDSSNMQPEDWVIIAECIFEALRDYDGFVVAHGTDTMAYTASALSFMLGDLDKPVVLTSSQLSIADDGTDARINILDACITASSTHLRGVFLVFHGKIILGCRAAR
jgi:L-asparaginase